MLELVAGKEAFTKHSGDLKWGWEAVTFFHYDPWAAEFKNSVREVAGTGTL